MADYLSKFSGEEIDSLLDKIKDFNVINEIPSKSITDDKIADSSITTSLLSNGSVTSQKIATEVVPVYRGILASGSNLNDIKDSSRYMLLMTNTYTNLPKSISSVYNYGSLETYWNAGNNIYQLFVDADGFNKYYRVFQSDVWSEWKYLGGVYHNVNASNMNIDNIRDYGTYTIQASTLGTFPEVIINYAILNVEWVQTYSQMQTLTIYEGNIYRRFYQSGTWSEWKKVYDARYPSAYKYPYIYNNRVMCNRSNSTVTAYYAGVDCGSNVKIDTISANYIWNKAQNGQSTGTVALISNPNGTDKITQITDLSLHLVLTATHLKVDVLGETYGKSYYQNLIDQDLITPQSLDGITEHTVTIVVASSQRVYVYIDDTDTYTGVFTGDENIPTLYDVIGQYAIFEHYCNGDMNNFAMPMFTYWTCRQGNTTYVYDNFDREDGQLQNTPQGLPYHLFSTLNNIG